MYISKCVVKSWIQYSNAQLENKVKFCLEEIEILQINSLVNLNFCTLPQEKNYNQIPSALHGLKHIEHNS